MSELPSSKGLEMHEAIDEAQEARKTRTGKIKDKLEKQRQRRQEEEEARAVLEAREQSVRDSWAVIPAVTFLLGFAALVLIETSSAPGGLVIFGALMTLGAALLAIPATRKNAASHPAARSMQTTAAVLICGVVYCMLRGAGVF